jgi:hypothetical protein
MRSIAPVDERRKTQTAIVCGHCHTKAVMFIDSSYSVAERGHGKRAVTRGETLWETLACSKCAMLSVRTGHSACEDEDTFKWEIVYPETRRAPRGLPFDVSRAYESAMLMRSVDPKAYAVVLGTVLDIICSDQGAWGQNLAYRLRDLASRALISQAVADIANDLSVFASPASFGRLADLEPLDIPLLEPLCDALILYIYVGPALIAATKRHEIKHR